MNFKLNWKGLIVSLISVLALIWSRKRRILKWIIATITMIVLSMILMFAFSTLKFWFMLFPIVVIILNIGVCLIIKAPRKWIIGSTITIFSISTFWIIKILIGNAKKEKEVITKDVNGTVSVQLS
jgi:hypothetical protein